MSPIKTTDSPSSFIHLPTYSAEEPYYFTGDECILDRVRMVGDAFREHWSPDLTPQYDGAQGTLGVINTLYRREWDETFARMAERYVEHFIDLDHPFGLNDEVRFGRYYKVGRKLLALYDYYLATGDERARAAFLRAVYEKFRFYQTLQSTSMGGSRGAFGGQSYMTLLFTIAYRWTENPAYLRMINRLVEDHAAADLDNPLRPAGIGRAMLVHHQTNPFLGLPAGLGVLAGIDEPIEPFPVLKTQTAQTLQLRKVTGQSVVLSVYVRVSNDLAAQTEPEARLAAAQGANAALDGVEIEKVQMAPTHGTRQDPRRWHFYVRLPADLPGGDYQLSFPEAGTIVVLESNAQALTAVAERPE